MMVTRRVFTGFGGDFAFWGAYLYTSAFTLEAYTSGDRIPVGTPQILAKSCWNKALPIYIKVDIKIHTLVTNKYLPSIQLI